LPLIKPHARKIYIAIVVIVFLFEIFIVFVGGNTTISLAINNFFGKTGTFSGRGLLWSNCLKAIHQKFYFGFGLQEADNIRYFIGNQAGAHNYYLDLIYQRGIVGLMLMIVLLISPAFAKDKVLEPIHYILIGFCGAYLIMFLAEPFIGTEVFHIPIFYITFMMTAENLKNKR
jgi:O-antigen ligase